LKGKIYSGVAKRAQKLVGKTKRKPEGTRMRGKPPPPRGRLQGLKRGEPSPGE